MKKLFSVLLTSLVFSTPLAAKSFDTISFGVDGGYPPFDVLSPSGEITGFDIDIANALCTQLKAKCVFVKQPFESMIAALNAGKFNAIIASLNITEERKKEVDFTDRYYRGAAQLVARKGSDLQPDVQSLKGKTVGVQTGSVHEAYAKKQWAGKGVKIVSYANQDNVYLDLMSGRINASLQDNIQAGNSFIDTPRGKNFAFAGPVIRDDSISSDVGIAVAKNNSELREALNEAIKAIRADGTYDTIQKKYFSFDIYGE
ncbi:ABC transporter substrate-binding protein [Chania multitudinisentens RB-25]|uniref:ABC transporter substrate-binding protein n=1 Tax=Chania multitudinisentens RB-25 TaxID=1441930 RepID=W0LDL0_9GAMM|nr:ABC transporter substrate-binding protein [Chania multitudinisentens]AHG21826.1 ABC transporter substrate-binding protein [Chania multitudinisentens RB-25]